MVRRSTAALAAIVIAIGLGACRDDTSKPPSSATMAAAKGSSLARMGSTYERDPHATVVKATDPTDATPAITAAMDSALRGTYRRRGGPDGNPQAVVYVPPGVYRLLGLQFRDNIRLEVDAGAVLQQATGTGGKGAGAKYLIEWDGPDARTPRRNVSIVGVGRSEGGVKQKAEPIEPGWSVDNAFTLDLDPRTTGSDTKVSGMLLMHVDGFLIENVFSTQNADDADVAPPTSTKAVLVLRPRNDSPVSGEFAQPRHGSIIHHYNVDSPRGFGPNQITAGQDLRISGVFSRGGTALRLETDATKNKPFGGTVRDVRADTIVGVECNRAVAFAPHAQHNADVHVRAVIARGCSQGVIESEDERLGHAKRGTFDNSTVSAVAVIAGADAQNPRQAGGSEGAWRTGESLQAFARDKSASWEVSYSDVYCAGTFERAPDRIMLGGSRQVPRCV